MTETVIIHEREADGVRVELLASFEQNPFNGQRETVDVSCHVVDNRNGTDFTIADVPRDRALEVFYHPFSAGYALLMRGSL